MPSDEHTLKFGELLRACRHARELTQEKLAEAAGLAADTIRAMEQGRCSASLSSLVKLARGLDMSLSRMFAGFERGQRDGSQELADTLSFLTSDEERAVLQFLRVFKRRFGGDVNA